MIKFSTHRKIKILLSIVCFYPVIVFGLNTQLVLAEITSVEPIYINHNIEKKITNCEEDLEQNYCWRYDYIRTNTKTLKGFRVTLNYNGLKYISRTKYRPNEKQIKIRIPDLELSSLIETHSSI